MFFLLRSPLSCVDTGRRSTPSTNGPLPFARTLTTTMLFSYKHRLYMLLDVHCSCIIFFYRRSSIKYINHPIIVLFLVQHEQASASKNKISGDLLLWVGVRRRPSCVNIFFLKTTGPILTKLVCSICRVRRQEIVNFMLPPPKQR